MPARCSPSFTVHSATADPHTGATRSLPCWSERGHPSTPLSSGFLSLGSYLRTVSSPLSSTPGWTPSQIEPRLLPPPQSHGLARNGANKPCGTGKHRGDGGRDTVSDGAPSTWLFMCGSQGARLPLQRPHQSESRTRLQPYNSSDRTAATTIPVWHTALAVGRIVDPRFPSFQKPAALVVGRPVVLAHDPLHAASLERTQRPLRHPRGRAVTGRRNCSRETDSRIAGGGRLVGPARATHSFPPGALLHPYSFLRLDQTTAASVTMPR